MRSSTLRGVLPLLVTATFVAAAAFSRSIAGPTVELKRVPNGGIQPQVAVDENGTVHLVYFTGDPSQGDLFYTRSKDGESFSDSIRVNSVPGTAVAIGNIRGARIALGRHGNVYVVWNGSAKLGEPALGRSPISVNLSMDRNHYSEYALNRCWGRITASLISIIGLCWCRSCRLDGRMRPRQAEL